MRKYIFIFKSELMTSLQYVFDVISRFISYFLIIFVFISLWKYIYSDPNEIINGYSVTQMMWYVIATELIWTSVGSRLVTRNISTDIRSGTIVYKLNKPYDYIKYNIILHMGEIFFKFMLFAIFAAIIGYIFIGSFPPITIPMLLIFIISTILAIIVNTTFAIIIGLFSFYIEDSGPLFWLYSKFILILGTIFPVEFFPGIFSKILKYSPIVAISYGPARLLVNFSYELALKVLLSQVFYIIVTFIIAKFIYKKGVKKLNVNGG